jgi:hypothetical protein
MTVDRTELNDLAAQHPEKVQQLERQWQAWRDSVSLPQAWRDPAIFLDQ